MTKQQAKQHLKSGEKVGHRLFMSHEYVMIDPEKGLIDERS